MINDKDNIQEDKDLDGAASPEQVEASPEQQGEVETFPATSAVDQASSDDDIVLDKAEESVEDNSENTVNDDPVSVQSSPTSSSISAPQSPASVDEQVVVDNAPIDQNATPSQIMDFLRRAGIKTGETASRLNRSVGSRVNNNRSLLVGTVAGGIFGFQSLTSQVSPLVPIGVGATLAATTMLGGRGVIKLGTSAYRLAKSNPLTDAIRAKIDEMRARREVNNDIEAQPAAQEDQTEAQPAAQEEQTEVQVDQPEAQPAAQEDQTEAQPAAQVDQTEVQVDQPEAQPAAQVDQTEVQGNTTKNLLSKLADMEDELNSTDSESTDPVIVGSKRSRPAVINSPESDVEDDSVIMELSGCSSSDSEENNGEGVEPSPKRPRNA